jgi:hypothetical protein
MMDELLPSTDHHSRYCRAADRLMPVCLPGERLARPCQPAFESIMRNTESLVTMQGGAGRAWLLFRIGTSEIADVGKFWHDRGTEGFNSSYHHIV